MSGAEIVRKPLRLHDHAEALEAVGLPE